MGLFSMLIRPFTDSEPNIEPNTVYWVNITNINNNINPIWLILLTQ